MRPIRLCFVITALGVGGAEHALLKLLGRLDRRKFLPSLIVLGQQDDLLPRFQAVGIEPVMLRLTPGRWPLAEIGRFLAAVREIAPDILQGWMYHGNLAASFAAARMQPSPKVCWSVRDTPDAAHAHSLFTRLVIRMSGWYLGRVDRIFNVSARSAAYCARELGWPAGRTELLPNGVDTALFQPDVPARNLLRQSLGIPDEVPVIGIVGRWSAVKNHVLFLEAFARFRAAQPEARAVLVGKGLSADNTELVAHIDRLGLQAACHLLGPCTDVQTVYPALDVFALTSRSEGFPNVLVEAMSCGVPVVTTDVGDAESIVGDTGRIAPPEAGAFAAALLAILPDARDRGIAARERVRQQYALDTIVARLEARYLALCQQAEA